MKFKQPYFVSPHAVERFRERVCDIPAAEIIKSVQAALQGPGLPVDAEVKHGKLSLIYRAEFRGREYYIPVVSGEEGQWPQVPTVLCSHPKFLKTRKHRSRFVTEEEKRLITLLRQQFTIRECMKITGRSHTAIERHSPKVRPIRRWTEIEKAKAFNMRTKGQSYEQIAEKLRRSRNSVEIFFCRLRKEVREDPDKLAILKVMAFCTDPGRIMKAARESGIVEEVKRRALRGEIDI